MNTHNETVKCLYFASMNTCVFLGEPLSTSKSVLFRVTSWPCLVPQEPGEHLAPFND